MDENKLQELETFWQENYVYQNPVKAMLDIMELIRVIRSLQETVEILANALDEERK